MPRGHLRTGGQFSWGLVGAIAPYVLRAVRAVKPDTGMPHFGIAYVLVSLGAVLLGGLWSVAMKSDPEWKAMYNGATFQLVFAFLVETARA